MEYKKKEVQAGFDRAADGYDRQAELQKTISDIAAGIAREYFPDHTHVLDLGCGTGNFSRYVTAHALPWKVTGLDLSFAMCARSSGVQGNWESLPFADAAFDAAFSSLSLQWVGDIAAAMGETARALKPGAQAVIATLAEGTLYELRESFRAADAVAHVHEFTPKESLLPPLSSAGFKVLALKEAPIVRMYPDVNALMRSIRAIGASNRHPSRARSFTRRDVFERMAQAYADRFGAKEGIPSTWNVLYLALEKQG